MTDTSNYTDTGLAIDFIVEQCGVVHESGGFWYVEDMSCGVILGVIYKRPGGFEWESDTGSGFAPSLMDSRYAIVASGFIFGAPALA